MKLLLVFMGIALMLITALCIKNKVKVKIKTFFRRGFAPKRGDFGLYVYDGKQGKGKTYSLVEYVLDNRNSIELLSTLKLFP